MTPRVSSLVLTLVLAAAALAAPVQVKPAGGGFSVTMPTKPQEQKQTSSVPGGSVDVYTFLSQDAGLLYLVGYGEYPESVIKGNPVRKLLEGDRDSFVKAVKGKIVREKDITLDGNTGIEFDVQTETGGELRVREYLVGRRIYQVVFGGAKGSLAKPSGASFFSSFKFVK